MLSASPRLRSTTAAIALGLLTVPAVADMPALTLEGSVESGKEIAMTRSKGNCIACHMIPGGESPGAIGPALVAIQTRYSSKADLAQQIWDPTVKNPDVVMPPFGKHGILSDQEFVDVVEYVWSL
ncbi:sulfur oxidation c-type cytochrome SoxX [Halochromatium glycolicum]|jgi:sulfur-oxidizing protein SoxX|uniref:Sulfur oxidation c-type cytochrome SoxX n=1 Tax=Halochromatium glycolicum TaxID=85075 RepID=A0AAJ0U7H0_9GAMM|nr:sulfur oxidation c-type cytochrome SoxX [Halochromatium glycolicum]MBK1706676.1 sulfur oxidation c-type cytochrome SoxX [Halochromatium glycolicum]